MKRPAIPKSVANRGHPGEYGAEFVLHYLFYIIDQEGLTFDEVAELAGISKESLKKWHGGKCFPRLDLIVACFEYLGYELRPMKTDVQPDRDASLAAQQRGEGPYYPIDDQWFEVEQKRRSQEKTRG